MELIENAVGINLDNLDPIIPLIRGPVLVVGAGQGLLVEELRHRGFDTEGIDLSPQMVEYANKRRGIKLFLIDANNMPFEKGQFKAAIVATGVIDYLNDPIQIGAILNEVRRVTDVQGEIFVALFGATPQFEELIRYIGFLSGNQLDLKAIGQIFVGSNNPLKQIIALIRNDPNKSVAGLVFRWIRAFISIPGRKIIPSIKIGLAVWKRIRKGEIPKPESVLDTLPEHMFIRTNEQIRDLFANLNFPPQDIMEFDNCKIVQTKNQRRWELV